MIREIMIIFAALVVLGVFILFSIFGFQSYGRWQNRLEAENQKIVEQARGQAEFMRAEHSRKIAVEEARAKDEAAEYLKNAEVQRAQGVAAAMDIIQAKLAGPEGLRYLHYLFIQGLNDGSTETIYVPTELNLPVLMGQTK